MQANSIKKKMAKNKTQKTRPGPKIGPRIIF
jgi:hypothetical protein